MNSIDVNKITPSWYVKDNILFLDIHYWKRNETTEGHCGSTLIWRKTIINGNLIAAYNSIVKSAKKYFDLPYLKKIKVDKSPAVTPIDENHDFDFYHPLVVFFIGVLVGMIFIKMLN